jgi:hypothetical protein
MSPARRAMRTECPECHAPLSLETDHAPTCRAGEMKRPNSGRYILGGDDGRQIIECPDLIYWAEWFEAYDRHIAHTIVGGMWEVSTIFLGLDMGHARIFTDNPDAPPQCFETLVFRLAGGRRNHTQTGGRWSTWAEAEQQHARLVASFEKAGKG